MDIESKGIQEDEYIDLEIEEAEENDSPSNGDADIFLFETRFSLISFRQFKGQSSAPTEEGFVISCNNVQQFKQKLWESISDRVQREVVFENDETPEWANKEFPTVDDIENYVIIRDPSGNRTHRVGSMTSNLLHNLKNKELHCFVQIFGNNVANSKRFKALKRILLDPEEADRAGAASNQIHEDILRRLKEVHQHRYSAANINWRLWANAILADDPARRENLINAAPPANIVHLFRTVQLDESLRLTQIARSNRVALGENERVRDHIKLIRESFDVLKAAYDLVSSAFDDLDARIRSLEIANVNASNILNDFDESLHPEEFASNLFDEIQNENDIDH